jgi:hypothetical protein
VLPGRPDWRQLAPTAGIHTRFLSTSSYSCT